MLYAPAGGAQRFRWRGRYYHLTYKGHIPPSILLAKLRSMSQVKVLGYSIVHEASDAEAPYDHTHLAWLWHMAVDLIGCDLMDAFDGVAIVHPNIESKKSIQWLQRVFVQYHAGHKTDGAGSPKFVKPVALWQELPQGFDWGEYLVTNVAEAPDLQAGVIAAGIQVKSVSDVLLLQTHKRPAPFDHNYPRSAFKRHVLPAAFVSRAVGTLHIWGAIRLGKTEWACAQFDNPLYVTSRDTLREFRPELHDGIVLDKMLFCDWDVEDAEQLTDWTQPAQIKCRYGLAKIPKRTPKIVVTNRCDAWPNDPHGQIVGRRVAQMHVVAPMF